MRTVHAKVVAILLLMIGTSAAHAGNSISVLQFGTTNQSMTLQTNSVDFNSATTLQFGSANNAVSIQTGTQSTLNSSTIGQGGTTATATNTAISGQVGGSNSSLIGQSGANNASSTLQFGTFNGSTVLQSSP